MILHKLFYQILKGFFILLITEILCYLLLLDYFCKTSFIYIGSLSFCSFFSNLQAYLVYIF